MKRFKNSRPVIAGIGEILWDLLKDSEELGGAPVNFAYHAGALGAQAYAISTIGDDARGQATLRELKKRGMSTEHITVLSGAVTGHVLAEVDEQGVASYTFPENVAWDRISIGQNTTALARKLDAVCFGSLVQRSENSREIIMNYVKNEAGEALKVFDLNIRQQFYTENIIRSSLECADVLKLNEQEIVLLAEMERLTGSEETQLDELVKRYHLKLAVLTRSGRGSLLVNSSMTSNHPGYATQVIDTIGAGDAFTATTILGLLKGDALDQINDHANRVAAFVCSRKGAMPLITEELIRD